MPIIYSNLYGKRRGAIIDRNDRPVIQEDREESLQSEQLIEITPTIHHDFQMKNVQKDVGTINKYCGVLNKSSTDDCRIEINMEEVEGGSISFLLDTGASASLINGAVLKREVLESINKNDAMNLRGLGNQVVQSIGTLETLLNINDHLYPCLFQVMNKELNLNTDGILGRDFLRDKVKIDFVNREIKVGQKDEMVGIPRDDRNQSKVEVDYYQSSNLTCFPWGTGQRDKENLNDKTYQRKMTVDVDFEVYFDCNGKLIKNKKGEPESGIGLNQFDYSNMQQKCYGWMENQGFRRGRGIGKTLQGKPTPVKAYLKFDKFGLGYVPTEDEDLNNFWNNEELLVKKINGSYNWIQFVKSKIKKCPTPDISSENIFSNSNGIFDIEIDKQEKKERSNIHTNEVNLIDQIIPPRMQTIVRINLPEKGVRVCMAQEIQPGLHLANSITQSDNGVAIVGIINTNDYEVNIKNVNIVTEPIYNFSHPSTKVIHSNNERVEKLKVSLGWENESDPDKRWYLYNICRNYNDVFLLPEEKLSHTNARVFKLPLLNDSTINLRQYRIPEKHKQEVAKQVKKLLENDIIETSISPFNSPLLLVPKKSLENNTEKLYRLCIDYRKLNKNLVPYQFPLPRIDEILDQLGKATIFSTLDLSQGFHQVMIDKADREKTAFSTAFGHYQYKRCPFGLKTLPGFFQSMLNSILTGLQGVTCFVYIDDVVIFAKDLEEHDRKLTDVLNRFRQYNLKLNPEKCHFMQAEVLYLGHKCSERGVEPDDKLIQSVINFPRPKNIKQVQSFHGLANYYRKFIKGFANIAAPLYKVIKKDHEFEWTEDCEQAFEELKKALTSKPVLQFPDFTKDFTITTDASAIGLGAILEQEGKVIAYASKTLSETKRGWSATELELKGVVFGCQEFRCYVLGRSFTVFTDHIALKGEIKLQNANTRIIKLMQKLSEFDLDIQYKKGKENGNADCLSRMHNGNDNLESKDCCNAITRRKAAQLRLDEQLSTPEEAANDVPTTNETDNLLDTPQLETENVETDNEYEDEDEEDIQEISEDNDKLEILKAHHDNVLGGHFGANKTYQRMKKIYHWNGMKEDVRKYIAKCEICQLCKGSRNTKMPLEITEISLLPFDKVYVDVVGPLPVSLNGNKYILSMVDDLTKFVEFAPMSEQTAETVAHTLYENILCRYTIPKQLVTDNGTNFVGKVFPQLCKLLGVKKLRTTVYHPQANLVERQHSTLGNYLRAFVKDKPTTWDTYLRSAAHAYNNTPHNGTCIAPMKMLFGFTSDIPTNLKKKPEPQYNYDSYVHHLKHKLQVSFQIAKENLKKRKDKSKIYYDKNKKELIVSEGMFVLVKNKHRITKLSKPWIGPYKVIKIHANSNVTIKKGIKEQRVHLNLLKKFTPRGDK